MKKAQLIGIAIAGVCGIEFAAQAAAVHGALLAEHAQQQDAPGGRGMMRRPAAGYIAALRAVRVCVPRLDDIEQPLEALAERIDGDDVTIVYALALRAGERELLAARATIVIDPSAVSATMGGTRT